MRRMLASLMVVLVLISLLHFPVVSADEEGKVVFQDEFKGNDFDKKWGSPAGKWEVKNGWLNATGTDNAKKNTIKIKEVKDLSNLWFYMRFRGVGEQENPYLKVYLRQKGGSDNTVIQFDNSGIKAGAGSPKETLSKDPILMNKEYDVKIGLKDKLLEVYIKGPGDQEYKKAGETGNVSAGPGEITFTASLTYALTNVIVKNRDMIAGEEPAAPGNLAATARNGKVDLKWEAASRAAAYYIMRGTTSGGPYAIVGRTSTPQYTDTGLVNDKTYYYTVKAGNKSGMSDESNESAAKPTGAPTAAVNSPIKHVFVIFPENRSFDNYFGTYPNAEGFIPLPATPAVNGIPTGSYNLDEKGNRIEPFLYGLNELKTEDAQHGYDAMISAYNQGRMDNYVQKNKKNVPMGHYDYRVIPGYWQLAQHYSMADNFYQSIFGPSTPGALYLIAAQSGNEGKPIKDDPDPAFGPWNKKTGLAEPLTYKNIGDVFNENQVSWAWYQGGYAKGDKYSAHHNPFQYFENFSKGLYKDNMKEYDQFADDIAKDGMPSVVYIKARSGEDEHPGSPLSEDFTMKAVHTIMSSKYWKDSAIIITYDESGGMWDHVPPPQVEPGPDGLQGLGPRVPTFVMSPYSKKNYVSHVQYDTTSVLKFMEWNFNLPPLNNRDANANNLLDMFDFDNPDFTPYIYRPDSSIPKSSYGTAVNVRLNNALLGVSKTSEGAFRDKSGNIMIPLKDFARNINAELNINGKQVIVIYNGHLFDFTVDSGIAAVDGVSVKLIDKIWLAPDKEPYISLRSIAKLPGFAVDSSEGSASIRTAQGDSH